MIRRFLVDYVIVLAVCMVVWGGGPVWAACNCTETVAECKAKEKEVDGEEGFWCTDPGIKCGTRPGYLYGTVDCKCVNRKRMSPIVELICQCRG
jgi:hypothetical protein